MVETSVLWDALALARKDLVVEFRRSHELISIVAFAVTSIIVSSFAWRRVLTLRPEVLSATLWMVVYFSNILTLTTSFSREVDRGTIDGLRSLPIPAYTVFLGKVIYGGVILFIVLLTTLFSSVIFLNVNPGVLPNLLGVFSLGVIDLALVGSIISALIMYSEGKTLLLSFLFFPVSVPILIPGTHAVGAIISGSGILDVLPELRLLTAFLLAFIVASTAFFSDIFFE